MSLHVVKLDKKIDPDAHQRWWGLSNELIKSFYSKSAKMMIKNDLNNNDFLSIAFNTLVYLLADILVQIPEEHRGELVKEILPSVKRLMKEIEEKRVKEKESND